MNGHDLKYQPVDITFNTEPVAKGRPRLGKHGVFTPKKTKDFEARLQYQWKLQRFKAAPKDLPLAVSIAFYFKKPKNCKRTQHTARPDLDNLLKALLDALNGFAWHDDSQIIDIYAIKRYVLDKTVDPHITLAIEEA